MRSEILNLLREKAPQPVSGQDLANHFGITRTAVWKHIQSLKKMGYERVYFYYVTAMAVVFLLVALRLPRPRMNDH